MQRRAIALALVAATSLGGLGGCKGKAKPADAPAATGSAPGSGSDSAPGQRTVASPGNGIPPATAPDTGFEARRAELLRRGNPEMMKDAPVAGSTAPPIDASKLIKQIDDHTLQIGTIKADTKAGRIEIPAKVADHTSTNAPLEYVAVAENGKAYESLLTVNATAIELRLALSLIGYEGTIPGDNGKVAPSTDADTVVVTAIVKGKERPVTAYMMDRGSKKSPADRPWQVVGFRPGDRDTALLTKDFFTLVPRDFYAPLQFTFYAGNPYEGPQTGYTANPKLLPTNAAVTLVIKRNPARPVTAAPDMTNPMMPAMPGMPGSPPPGM